MHRHAIKIKYNLSRENSASRKAFPAEDRPYHSDTECGSSSRHRGHKQRVLPKNERKLIVPNPFDRSKKVSSEAKREAIRKLSSAENLLLNVMDDGSEGAEADLFFNDHVIETWDDSSSFSSNEKRSLYDAVKSHLDELERHIEEAKYLSARYLSRDSDNESESIASSQVSSGSDYYISDDKSDSESLLDSAARAGGTDEQRQPQQETSKPKKRNRKSRPKSKKVPDFSEITFRRNVRTPPSSSNKDNDLLPKSKSSHESSASHSHACKDLLRKSQSSHEPQRENLSEISFKRNVWKPREEIIKSQNNVNSEPTHICEISFRRNVWKRPPQQQQQQQQQQNSTTVDTKVEEQPTNVCEITFRRNLRPRNMLRSRSLDR